MNKLKILVLRLLIIILSKLKLKYKTINKLDLKKHSIKLIILKDKEDLNCKLKWKIQSQTNNNKLHSNKQLKNNLNLILINKKQSKIKYLNLCLI
jgi:hypothetical protein